MRWSERRGKGQIGVEKGKAEGRRTKMRREGKREERERMMEMGSEGWRG